MNIKDLRKETRFLVDIYVLKTMIYCRNRVSQFGCVSPDIDRNLMLMATISEIYINNFTKYWLFFSSSIKMSCTP